LSHYEIFLSIFINYTATPLKTLINIDPVGSIVIRTRLDEANIN